MIFGRDFEHLQTLFSVTILLGISPVLAQEKTLRVVPDDSRLAYSDYVHLQFATLPDDPALKVAQFDRVLDMPGKGYRWDNPGARIRFRTDAPVVTAELYYSTHHISTSARNGQGLCYIDGQGAGTFNSRARSVVRQPERVLASLPRPAQPGFHDYELVLPYGDSVEFLGLRVGRPARFEPPPPRTPRRYVAYGDSITQGFTASDVGQSYAFRLAQKKNWQVLNMGFGGRASTPADGRVVAALQADVITVLIGANDWQAGVPPERCGANVNAFLANLRAVQPQVPVYVLTPLWVAASWQPRARVADLESYRQVLREVVYARHDPDLHLIEGPDLIAHDLALFDPVVVHPNDQGFAMMAERLAARVADLPGR